MRRVEVVAYDPTWPMAFRAEAMQIGVALGEGVLALHHIGSTSVPGLAAKPVIDILGVCQRLEDVATKDAALAALGYIPRGPSGISGRLFYRKHTGQKRSHHLHMFEATSDHIRRHLGFRNYLATHSRDRRAYQLLKDDLAEAHPNDIQAYMDGKDSFIREIDRRVASGASSETLAWPAA